MTGDIYDGSYLTTDPDGGLRRKRAPDDMICDFCCQKLGETCWTYPCGEMELPMLDDPSGLRAMSDDGWACCEDCHPLVSTKQWRKLSEVSLTKQIAQSGIRMEIPDWAREQVLTEAIAHFERFDAHRIGSEYQEHTPYLEHK